MNIRITGSKRIITISMLIFLILCQLTTRDMKAYTDYTEEMNYVYNRNGQAMKIPTAYEYKNSVYLMELAELEGKKITSPVDMFVHDSGEIYIVESELAGILIFDVERNFVKLLDNFKGPNGESLKLKKPQGIFVSKDYNLYICDTENRRILVSDIDGNVSQIIEKPENILGTDLNSFLPMKVVVDSAGRISVVARNMNSGIMQFTKEGVFTGYSGAPSVTVDAFTKLLRKFSTKEQRAQMQTFVPTEYNNIKIDESNFIWGSISAISGEKISNVINSQDLSGSVTPIKKLNTMGVDVLRRKGVFAPLGELMFMEIPSKIVDIGLGPNNIYSMLDSYNGKIFTYNNDGILLYVFANKGSKKGNLQTPIAIDYVGNEILVLDSALGQILIYEPTYYGQLLIEGEEYFEQGEYELANEKWREVAERNSNFEYAYVGLGNAKYNTKEYEQAMEFFEYADDAENYSKAKEQLRKEQSEKIFPILFITIILVTVTYFLINVAIKVRRYARGEEKTRKGEDES